MIFTIKVKTGAKTEVVENIDEKTHKISVTARPKKGRANEATQKALAKCFQVVKNRIRIVTGHTTKTKLIEIKK